MKATVSQSVAASSEALFSQIAHLPGAVWLDSSLQTASRGRYSLIARSPRSTVTVTADGTISLDDEAVLRGVHSPDAIQYIMERWLDPNCFNVGYVGYEGAVPFVGAISRHRPALPVMQFFRYGSVLTYDHVLQEYSVSDPDIDDFADLFASAGEEIDSVAPSSGQLLEAPAKQDYFRRMAAVKEHIREGDIYQANLTFRYTVSSQADPFAIYRQLRVLNPAPYAAFLSCGSFQVLSSSPERMFLKKGHSIFTGPIKGTIERGTNAQEEAIRLGKLLNSAKDRAELLMIVDLMRNDLGRIARPGTVHVDKLFKPEVYSSLIHLVADISATVRDDISWTHIFEAMLPGGSVTGAPKRRAVEIIDALEMSPRSVYTGSIGYIHKDSADFNIAIRTITHTDGAYQLHAGGGIVADSEPESEYAEMSLKAANLLRAAGVDPTKAT